MPDFIHFLDDWLQDALPPAVNYPVGPPCEGWDWETI